MPANDIPQTAEGSPMPLEHTRSCGALIQDACTCGLGWRIRLATEQEMHAAWRKRAEEAEALQSPPPREADAALWPLVDRWQKANAAYEDGTRDLVACDVEIRAAEDAMMAYRPPSAPAPAVTFFARWLLASSPPPETLP